MKRRRMKKRSQTKKRSQNAPTGRRNHSQANATDAERGTEAANEKKKIQKQKKDAATPNDEKNHEKNQKQKNDEKNQTPRDMPGENACLARSRAPDLRRFDPVIHPTIAQRWISHSNQWEIFRLPSTTTLVFTPPGSSEGPVSKYHGGELVVLDRGFTKKSVVLDFIDRHAREAKSWDADGGATVQHSIKKIMLAGKVEPQMHSGPWDATEAVTNNNTKPKHIVRFVGVFIWDLLLLCDNIVTLGREWQLGAE